MKRRKTAAGLLAASLLVGAAPVVTNAAPVRIVSNKHNRTVFVRLSCKCNIFGRCRCEPCYDADMDRGKRTGWTLCGIRQVLVVILHHSMSSQSP